MKPTLIFSPSPGEHSWVSAKNQENKILELYLRFYSAAHVFSVPERPSDFASQQIANLSTEKARHYIFTGIRPHPKYVLNKIQLDKDSTFYFHLYGNFFGELRNWLELETQLLHQKVCFFCASQRQKYLVSHFLNSSENVKELPLPLADPFWNFDNKSRENFRRQHNIKADDKVFAYSGRLSLQKNLDLIIEGLNSLAKRFPQKRLYFFCAGDFDDISAPYINIELPEGYYYSSWQKICQKIHAPNLTIHHLGHLAAKERKALYCGADSYISLSLHHAEAFGVSPLEALLCGLPSILTDWGGYHSFKNDQTSLCQTVKTKVNEQGCFIHQEQLTTILDQSINKDFSIHQRKAEAQYFHNYYSAENFLKKLSEIDSSLIAPFQGFSPQAKKAVDQLYEGFGPRPFDNQYIDIFKCYSGEKHGKF